MKLSNNATLAESGTGRVHILVDGEELCEADTESDVEPPVKLEQVCDHCIRLARLRGDIE